MMRDSVSPESGRWRMTDGFYMYLSQKMNLVAKSPNSVDNAARPPPTETSDFLEDGERKDSRRVDEKVAKQKISDRVPWEGRYISVLRDAMRDNVRLLDRPAAIEILFRCGTLRHRGTISTGGSTRTAGITRGNRAWYWGRMERAARSVAELLPARVVPHSLVHRELVDAFASATSQAGPPEAGDVQQAVAAVALVATSRIANGYATSICAFELDHDAAVIGDAFEFTLCHAGGVLSILQTGFSLGRSISQHNPASTQDWGCVYIRRCAGSRLDWTIGSAIAKEVLPPKRNRGCNAPRPMQQIVGRRIAGASTH